MGEMADYYIDQLIDQHMFKGKAPRRPSAPKKPEATITYSEPSKAKENQMTTNGITNDNLLLMIEIQNGMKLYEIWFDGGKKDEKYTYKYHGTLEEGEAILVPVTKGSRYALAYVIQEVMPRYDYAWVVQPIVHVFKDAPRKLYAEYEKRWDAATQQLLATQAADAIEKHLGALSRMAVPNLTETLGLGKAKKPKSFEEMSEEDRKYARSVERERQRHEADDKPEDFIPDSGE